jgi:hypothetical protein
MRQKLSKSRCRIVLTLDDGRATKGARIPQIDTRIAPSLECFERNTPLGLEEIANQLLKVLA